MLFSFLLCMLFIPQIFSTPFKLSLFLALLSTLSSFLIYETTNSVFIPAATVISFSSGMMILFSYCSVMTNHESKNYFMTPSMKTWTSLFFFLIFPSLLIFSPSSSTAPLMQKESLTTSGFLLLLIMALVIISMKCMNLTFFNPTKKFMESY